jgi:hypothetical protein
VAVAYVKWSRGILPCRLRKGAKKHGFPRQVACVCPVKFRSLLPRHTFCTFDENVKRKYVDVFRLTVPTLSHATKEDVKKIQ